MGSDGILILGKSSCVASYAIAAPASPDATVLSTERREALACLASTSASEEMSCSRKTDAVAVSTLTLRGLAARGVVVDLVEKQPGGRAVRHARPLKVALVVGVRRLLWR